MARNPDQVNFQVAKGYVESALNYSKDIAIGGGSQRPFDHFLKINHRMISGSEKRRFNPESLLLYAVTDSRMNKKWGRSITEAVEAAIEGGATMVQLRLETSNVSIPYLGGVKDLILIVKFQFILISYVSI